MRDNVNNYRDYAEDYRFVAASVRARALWFYGAYDFFEDAEKAAEDIDGVVLEQTWVQVDETEAEVDE